MTPSARAAAASCAEVAQDGVVLYQDRPDLPVLPASNMKLLTATALLDGLGPNYTFTTTLLALRVPVNGVVEGDLYFVGGGDPLLREPHLRKALFRDASRGVIEHAHAREAIQADDQGERDHRRERQSQPPPDVQRDRA